MTRSLRSLLSTSAAVCCLLLTVAPATFSQSSTPGSANAISTSTQIPQVPGNFAIIPPGKSDKLDAAKPAPGNTEGTPAMPGTAATPAPQVPNVGDRAISRDRNAPRRDNLQGIRITEKHINALIGGFEQSAGLGFGVEFTTADSLPVVELRARALTSTKLYRRFELGAYVPKLFDNENTHLDLWFNYQKRTRDDFFGIGPRVPEEPKTNFASDERSYNLVVSHDFTKGIQVGGFARFANSDAYRGEDDKDIPVDTLYSGSPAVTPITRWIPGLNTNAQIFSYGGFAEFDLRNNTRGLPKGGYGYARVASYDGKNDPLVEFGWNEVVLDGRAYIPLASDFTSLALRAFVELRDPKDNRQIPFYEQSFLGGRSHNRGFDNFRFRANNMLLFSVEPRRTVWKQSETRGVDVFAFGDGGQVWGDNRSTINPLILANDKFRSENWRFAIGGGAQYRWNKNLAVRVDIGHSNESTRVYFSLSRGF